MTTMPESVPSPSDRAAPAERGRAVITDPQLVAILRDSLTLSARLTADAVMAPVRHYIAQRDQGVPYQPDQQLVDEYVDHLVSLDRSWRNYVRQTGQAAAPIVSQTLEAHVGSTIATIIENLLERYRCDAHPGHAEAQKLVRERTGGR